MRSYRTPRAGRKSFAAEPAFDKTPSVLERLFRRWDPPAELRPRSDLVRSSETLSIRWLGTACHKLEYAGRTLVIDPFVSRPRFRQLLRPLRSDEHAIARWIPDACGVVVGHAHYDHLLDGAAVAKKTGAIVLGSRSTARVALGQGVERGRIRATNEHGLATEVGPFAVELVPSRHAKILLGRASPFPGEIARTPRRPMRIHEYRDGGALGVLVRAGGTTVYHNGSADLVDAELDGKRADVVIAGIAGWRFTPGYVERLIRILRPKLVVPTHYDAFFSPLEDGVRLLPGVDLSAFVEEVRRVAPGVRVVAPTPWDDLLVAPAATSFSVVRGD